MSEVTNEKLILSSLARNDQYARKIIPFLKEEYFSNVIEQRVYQLLNDYIAKYNRLPNKTDMAITIRNDSSITETQTDEAIKLNDEIYSTELSNNEEWLLSTTEAFCQDKSVFNAIQKAISIYQGTDKNLTHHAIPDLLKDAIAVCFDSKVGIDFFDDAEKRYDYYTSPETKIPFHLDILNEVTCGGVSRKTLNLLVAGVNCFVGGEKILVRMNPGTLDEFKSWLSSSSSLPCV